MRKTRSHRVVVVGGSLGGLTSALLLRDLGCDVDVYERSDSKLSGFGAGIVVHEATMRYFRQRGVEGGLEVPAAFFRYLDPAGAVVHEEPGPYTFTAWSTLYRNLLALFGSDRYHHGHALETFEQADGGVDVRFANGRRVRADLLVCADGVLSTARARLAPEAQPVYAGYVGWRGTVEAGRLSPASAEVLGDAITYGVIDQSHILAYPIPGGNGETGPLLNFVWYRNVPAGPALDDLMLDRHGRPRQISLHPGDVRERHVEELRRSASEQLAPALAELVQAAESPFVQVIVDVAVEAMAFGRVCLLGDAAFAARPHAAAGTAKAAENGWKLAEAVAAADGDLEEALRRWEPGQLQLGRLLVERSRRIGERYQVTSTAQPDDPELRFGLYGAGR
jgi:2,6-dihydroxypyridine 3-monooxygenase